MARAPVCLASLTHSFAMAVWDSGFSAIATPVVPRRVLWGVGQFALPGELQELAVASVPIQG
eukprot:10674649-Lingulodinium_polyedra.AAC.1